ncbi:putative surface layer protein, partial [Lactobacillus kimbladii]
KIEKITEDAINKIKALQDSEKTDLENAIKYANDEFEKKYKEAIARLKKEFSDSAKTTEVDNVFNKYKGITGSTLAEVNAKEIAAERELAKGEVRDTATNAEARVDNLKHKDGTVYTDNEKKALKKQIQKDVLEANGSKDQSGTLDKPSDTEGIDTVRNEAVNKIISEAIADSQEGEKVLQHDPDVLLERLAKAHKAAVDKLQKFGPNINHDQTDKNYEEAKKALNSNPTDLATELAGEKLIANGALTDAKTAADNIVDSNTDYSSTVKDKIKQQIQKDFDKATNRINESPAVSELITQKRNDGIDQLYRDAIDTNVNVTNVINSGGGSDQVTNITNINPDNNQNNQTPNMPENSQEPAKTVRVVLKHNAYLYDNNGHRANGVTLGIGSILETIGTETINNRQYYVLVDQGANG